MKVVLPRRRAHYRSVKDRDHHKLPQVWHMLSETGVMRIRLRRRWIRTSFVGGWP
jgi:hypothetical protein